MTELKTLWDRSGLSQSDAIRKANQRLRGGEALKPQTVSDWLAGTPAAKFEQLWALVEVFLVVCEHRLGRADLDRKIKHLRTVLKASGPAVDKAEAQAAMRNLQNADVEWRVDEARWKALWEVARSDPAPGPDPQLGAYLKAASRAAGLHPYPCPSDDPASSPPAEVYVHQRAKAQPARTPAQTSRLTAAEDVFAGEDRIRVLLAGAGTGKSTLLRRHLADSADHLLNSRRSNRARAAVPVLVRATDLVGAPSLPQVLAAAATTELSPFGLRKALAEDLFQHHPRPQMPWLVMVDGLDEVPDHATRVTLLDQLAREAATKPFVYRFVVATRPLPDQELDRLGPTTVRFELQPFASAGLRAYAQGCFSGLPDAGHHVMEFMDGLTRSGLHSLACTPLMASMLCRLYATNPARPLPEGRTGAYESFVRLLYEENTHKNIRGTHDRAIALLKDRHQIPQDLQAAEQAAEQVRNRLPELIGLLAYARISGNTDPAVKVLAPHLHTQRPHKIKESLWNAFLGNLLRPTGLLVERADDFEFVHQTLLEYHAARHATRDKQARDQLLDALFPLRLTPVRGGWRAPDLDPSYLGFLLDGLLNPQDDTAADTGQALEHLLAPGGHAAYLFLTTQLNLSTNLPPHTAASQLTRLISTTLVDGYARVEATATLARMEGYQQEGTRVLAAFAYDALLETHHRIHAARSLAGLDGHRAQGARLLAAFANDPTLYGHDRVYAATDLAELDEYREEAAGLLAALATNRALDHWDRVEAAAALADLDGHQGEAVELLAAIANDSTTPSYHRMQAARRLVGLAGHQGEAAGPLTAAAADATLADAHRVTAAETLANLDGCRAKGTELLVAFAEGPGLDSYARVQAAEALAKLGEERATGWLASFADNHTVEGFHRVLAAKALAGLDGHRAEGAELLVALADDPVLGTSNRVTAAQDLADKVVAHEFRELEGYREEAVALLVALAGDPALDDRERVRAAWNLARFGDERAAGLLTAFVKNPFLDAYQRVGAAKALALIDGHRQEAVHLLVAFADDSDSDICVEAAQALTDLSEGRVG
ncbi:ATP-binding protein [Streptomyces monashensis]|uniref:ATP-binding protein n=1 Tax=Streptomyces monashensis TaxID=1678012 RepID=UPI0033CDA76A